MGPAGGKSKKGKAAKTSAQDPYDHLARRSFCKDAEAAKVIWARVKGYPFWPVSTKQHQQEAASQPLQASHWSESSMDPHGVRFKCRQQQQCSMDPCQQGTMACVENLCQAPCRTARRLSSARIWYHSESVSSMQWQRGPHAACALAWPGALGLTAAADASAIGHC